MSELTKYIYFPSGQENGMQRNVPVIVYCFDLILNNHKMYIKASRNKEQAERQAGQFLLADRAVVYREDLWRECLFYISKKKHLDDEYEQLFKKRK